MNSKPIAHVYYKNARHSLPLRLQEITDEDVTGIQLSRLSQEEQDFVVRISDYLKWLDISNLKLKNIPKEFGNNLCMLQTLKLSDNNLSDESFPQSFSKLHCLVDLSFERNNLNSVPQCLVDLKNLKRLNLSDNKIKRIDRIIELTKLKTLILDRNQIENIPSEFYSNMRLLENLYLSFNKITELHSDIRHMHSLNELNVSDNLLSFFQGELLTLSSIENLMLGKNRINNIPTVSLMRPNESKFISIDLSENNINIFPGNLLSITRSLDLSCNNIRSINSRSFSKLDYRSTKNLCLIGNPLTTPPIEICIHGVNAIIQYFRASEINVRTYQGIKIFVLGDSESGKTSFIHSFIDQQCNTPNDSRSQGIEIYESSIDLNMYDNSNRNLPLYFWDCSASQDYLPMLYNFLHSPAIYLLCFDIRKYSEDKFHAIIGCWVDRIIIKCNSLSLILVATHSDLLDEAKISKKCENVIKNVHKHLDIHIKRIEEKVNILKNEPYISASLSNELKKLVALSRLKICIHPQVISFSSVNLSGVKSISDALVEMTKIKDFFPNVMETVPNLWSGVEYEIEELASSMTIPIMKWNDFYDHVTNKLGMESFFQQIALYFNDISKIIWMKNHSKLKNYVILNPMWLITILNYINDRQLTFDEYLIKDNNLNLSKSSKLEILNANNYWRKTGCIKFHVIVYKLQKLIGTDNYDDAVNLVWFLIDNFDLGYKIDNPINDAKSSILEDLYLADNKSKAQPLTSSRDKNQVAKSILPKISTNHHEETNSDDKKKKSHPNRIFSPYLNELKSPCDLQKLLNSSFPKIMAVYKFLKCIPAGLFDALTVRVAAQNHVQPLYHWDNNFVLQSNISDAIFIIYKDNHTMIKIGVVMFNPKEENINFTAKWEVIMGFLYEAELLLSDYTGILVERLMQCPICCDASFFGEWKYPREFQSVAEHQCPLCEKKVGMNYLIQPKSLRNSKYNYTW